MNKIFKTIYFLYQLVYGLVGLMFCFFIVYLCFYTLFWFLGGFEYRFDPITSIFQPLF